MLFVALAIIIFLILVLGLPMWYAGRSMGNYAISLTPCEKEKKSIKRDMDRNDQKIVNSLIQLFAPFVWIALLIYFCGRPPH